MKHYFLEESIENLQENRNEAIEKIEAYYKNYSKEEILELLIRGEVHAFNDKRTNGYYSK